ncbi:MAG: TonB-dependent receptor [Paludibacter sp.]|nr:TonB-dependent receptor [Paludibacter sp.]
MILGKTNHFKVTILLFLLVFLTQINATTIKGRILDSKTQEPLTGAIIIDKLNDKINDEARLDGSYFIKKIKPGKHLFSIQYVGYIKQEKEVYVSGNKDVVLDILMEPRKNALAEVQIVGKLDKESSDYARSSEKRADNLLNIISARSIQLSPDITVANVLQRVSGVTVQKTSNSGEGQYAIIRGMDKRYNYTLINGIKIPSPNDKNRYVPMDIFPAELISRIEVIKALTPDMEGDAIGGVMNLVMKDAPDKLLISINGSVGYNKMFFDRPFYQFNTSAINPQAPSERGIPNASPSDFPIQDLIFKGIKPFPNLNGGISFGDRFFDKRLGFVLAISNQNTYSGSDAFVTVPRAQPNPGTLPAFETKENRTYSTLQNRLGIHNKLDFQIDRNNKISLYNAYFELNKYDSRHVDQTSLSTGVGNVDVYDRSQTQLEKIYNSTLQGNHNLTNTIKLDWSAVFSKAWANNPDEAELHTASSDFGNTLILNGISHKWRNNSDQDLAAYLNVFWNPAFLPKNAEIKAGGMFRHKTRHNFYTEYSLDPSPNPQTFSTIENATVLFSGYNANAGSPVNQNDYDVTEDLMAGYGQIKFKILTKLNVLVGVRVEHDLQNYTTPMPATFPGRAGIIPYMDILPSLHLKYELSENQNLRLSYFSSISRPGFFEIIPYNIKGETFDEKGNPNLKEAKAANVDLRYELFPRASEQILVGAFYKNIVDPIEYSLVREAGPSALQLKPQNFGTATNYGVELVFNKYFGNFGVSANYTYTKSSITTYKKTYGRSNPADPTSQLVTDSVLRTRPMQGQADHIGNLSLLYKNQKIGLDCQFSLVYTGQYISQVSGWDGLDFWSMPNTTIDFSFEQRLSKKFNLSIFGKARNLLNSAAITRILKPNDYYLPSNIQLPQQDSPNSIVVQKEQYGQNFLLGFRYLF